MKLSIFYNTEVWSELTIILLMTHERSDVLRKSRRPNRIKKNIYKKKPRVRIGVTTFFLMSDQQKLLSVGVIDTSKKRNGTTETSSHEEFKTSSLLTLMYVSYFLESPPSAIYEWPLLRFKKKKKKKLPETEVKHTNEFTELVETRFRASSFSASTTQFILNLNAHKRSKSRVMATTETPILL